MMMYLSKGMEVQTGAASEFRVCRWGKVYALGPITAALWRKGAAAPAQAADVKGSAIRRLEEMGLVVTTEESRELAAFRLLTDCVLCPSGKRPFPLWGRERRIWAWLTQAGLRLTSSELICLEERNILPVPELLGESGRQALTEEIYTNTNIFDGILETEMEHSPARDATISAILKLVRTRHLLLI